MPSTAASTAVSTRHAGRFGGGTTTHDTWFGGPIGSRVSPLSSVTNGSPPPTRENNELFLSMGAFTDAAGHLANSDIFSAEYNGKIYVDDVLEHDIFASVFMNATIPAGDHRIRVVTDIQRENLFWQQSTGIKTEWTFESDQPTGALQVLPMLGIDYAMPCPPPTVPPPAGSTSRSGSRCRTRWRRSGSSSGASTSRGTGARPGARRS